MINAALAEEVSLKIRFVLTAVAVAHDVTGCGFAHNGYAVHHGAFIKGEARVMMGEVNALFVVAGTDEEVTAGDFIQEKAHIF